MEPNFTMLFSYSFQTLILCYWLASSVSYLPDCKAAGPGSIPDQADLSVRKITCVIHWIEIYPVDSVMHLSNTGLRPTLRDRHSETGAPPASPLILVCLKIEKNLWEKGLRIFLPIVEVSIDRLFYSLESWKKFGKRLGTLLMVIVKHLSCNCSLYVYIVGVQRAARKRTMRRIHHLAWGHKDNLWSVTRHPGGSQ